MSIRLKIKNSIDEALKALDIEEANFVVEHPAEVERGDYSTNVAMALSKKLKSNPAELATKIVLEINKNLPTEVEKVEAVGGFINFYLNKYFFEDSIKNIVEDPNLGQNDVFAGKKIMVEYTDPNPFKPFHIGHLMTNAIGESIARIIENAGAEVFRANYQGDVGLHVAKALYVISKDIKKFVAKEDNIREAAQMIGEAYAEGSKAYEEDPKAKEEIDAINKKIYERSDESLIAAYDWGFKITMEAFEEIYRMLGTKFDYYFLESEMAVEGSNTVKENIGKIFTESEGAVVFKAEEHDPKLHTRVFITKNGLPTYETKELALCEAKFVIRPNLDLSIVITANEQAEYMRVVTKALSLLKPQFAEKMRHITHGMMRFAQGKMSSRLGNVITGESLLRDVDTMVEEKMKESGRELEGVSKKVAVAAIKYGILKQTTKSDIIFDLENAISFEGDSGPYLQYSYARSKSLLEKGEKEGVLPSFDTLPQELTLVEKLLYRFPEVARRAAEEFEPHYIASYLIETSRAFNSFYGNTKIVDTEDLTSPYKLALTLAYSKVLQKGLHLLGIEAPERM